MCGNRHYNGNKHTQSMQQGNEIRQLQQMINNTDYKTAEFPLQFAFAQPYYNATTGNYGDDPNNPNNADNIIIKYCLDHADRVEQVRMQFKTWQLRVWFLHITMEKHANKSMTNIQRLFRNLIGINA